MIEGQLFLGLGIGTLGLLIMARAWIWLRPRIRQSFFIAPSEALDRGEPSADAKIDAISADQAFLGFAERFLANQFTANDNFDTKATTTLGVGSTVLPLTFGLLALSGRQPPLATIWCLALAILAYSILLVFVILATHIRGFEYRPTLKSLAKYSQEFDGLTMRRWIAEEYAISAELNRPLLERKARHVGFGFVALFVEGALISIAALVSLFG